MTGCTRDPYCLQVASYEEDADGVTLHFDDGHSAVQAKVLIGADGYFSRIRKQCLNDGPPMFAVSLCRGKAHARLCKNCIFYYTFYFSKNIYFRSVFL